MIIEAPQGQHMPLGTIVDFLKERVRIAELLHMPSSEIKTRLDTLEQIQNHHLSAKDNEQ